MRIFAIFYAAMFLISVTCCNPVKRVLDSNDKTQKVVNAYMLRTPFKIDTTYKYLPGDTLTQVLIGYDTTFIKGDTVLRVDTLKIKETALKIKTVRDTVVKTISDNRLLAGCQQTLLVKEAAFQQAMTDKKDAQATAHGWMIKFWGLLGTIILVVGMYVIVKLKIL